MDYPKPVTVHFYPFRHLHDALNYVNIANANLPEIAAITVHDSRSLEFAVKRYPASRNICLIAEEQGNIIASGIPSGGETARKADLYFQK